MVNFATETLVNFDRNLQLLSANMNVLYAAGINLLIILPYVQYNLVINLDLNLVWQSFFAELN
ncbi:MAG TPA: hypothetical protein VF298_05210, partial [Bacteroidales bacterium]